MLNFILGTLDALKVARNNRANRALLAAEERRYWLSVDAYNRAYQSLVTLGLDEAA